MKSRYAPLVKLKKQALDKAERSLLNANAEVAACDTALANAYALLSELSSPQNGSLGEFVQAQLIIQAQHREIEECRFRLAEAQQKQGFARAQFKNARIEFEKFNYLEVEDVKKEMAKAKYEEAKMLDEIGTMTYKKGW